MYDVQNILCKMYGLNTRRKELLYRFTLHYRRFRNIVFPSGVNDTVLSRCFHAIWIVGSGVGYDKFTVDTSLLVREHPSCITYYRDFNNALTPDMRTLYVFKYFDVFQVSDI